jgi:N-acetylglucosamine-6-phosphate deacetylase
MKGFKNANIYIEGKGIVKSSLVIENGKIASFDETKDLMTLREDLIVVPGFIDKHIHGANHSDAMYPSLEDIKNISKTIAREGVTSYMPTTMTQSEENIDKALKNIKEYIEKKNKDGAFVLGTHLEGPFISPKFKGAQPEQYIVPCSVEKFMHYQAVSGNNIKQVTLAYEENGKDLCNYLLSQGIVASIGHTNATALEVLEAAKNGVTSATHTYNAMKPLHHREAGTVGGVMLADTIYAELIADLVHVSPEAIKVLCKIKGLDKIVLVTDGIESKHLPDGTYSLGGQEVTVKGREARLNFTDNFSNKTLFN